MHKLVGRTTVREIEPFQSSFQQELNDENESWRLKMIISAKVQNREGQHQVTLCTDDIVHQLIIPPKSTGFGSSANGGEFGAEGEPARNVSYRAKVTAQASEAEIQALMTHTDRVAEIQNTLRQETPVALSSMEMVTL